MKIFKERLDQPWRSYQFCSVDVEATGLDLRNDEVVSIGAVTITDGRFKGVDNFYEEIVPSKSPSRSAVEIHGLRGIDLESARPADQVIPELIGYIGSKYLIAHASWVEKAFLSDRMKRYGYKYPKKVVDTAALARFAGYAEKESGHEPSLEFLARQLNLPVYTPHHALGDAMTTAAVFLALATRIEQELYAKNGQMLTLSRLIDISKR